MPKIIPDIQTTIFTATKSLLQKHGYTGISLRMIAAECNISVGTIYNYYPNKLLLVLDIIQKDWLELFVFSQQEYDEMTSINTVLLLIFRKIRSFPKEYWNLFNQFSGESMDEQFIHNHRFVIKTISDLIRDNENRFGLNNSDPFLNLIAEMILTAAIHECNEEAFIDLTARIYPKQ